LEIYIEISIFFILKDVITQTFCTFAGGIVAISHFAIFVGNITSYRRFWWGLHPNSRQN